MKIGVVSVPEFYSGELDQINALFECGLERLHLRKPEADIKELRELLNHIDARYHQRIVVHGFQSLLNEFHLGGLHYSRWASKTSLVGLNNKGVVSYPAHSQLELAQVPNDVTQLVISPLFASISKPGYRGVWKEGEVALLLTEQNRIGGIEYTALGGISPHNLNEVKEMGFSTALVLGHVWGKEPQTETASEIVTRYEECINALK